MKRLVPVMSGVAAAGIAFAVKQHYSTASADDLAWILRPTVALVSIVTGVPFVHEAGVGWMNLPLRYSIVPACSGVNFWVVVFLSIAWALLRAESRPAHAALALSMAAFAAYGATVVANTIRISIALAAYGRDLHPGGLDAASVHRLLGVLIYVPALFVAHEIADRVARRFHA